MAADEEFLTDLNEAVRDRPLDLTKAEDFALYALGVDHPETLTARNNLAVSYASAGRVVEAIGLQERVLLELEAIVGVDHPDTMTARAHLARSYQSTGRTPEAIQLLERVLIARERILGAGHADTLRSRLNLELARSKPHQHIRNRLKSRRRVDSVWSCHEARMERPAFVGSGSEKCGWHLR